jgi:hypothetical protein
MLIHLLSDAIRNPSLFTRLKKEGTSWLSADYPEVTPEQKKLLEDRKLIELGAELGKELVDRLHSRRDNVTYGGGSLEFKSITPSSGPVEKELTLNLVYAASLVQPPAKWPPMTLQFFLGSEQVNAPITSTQFDQETAQLKLTASAMFRKPGDYQAVLQVEGMPDPIVQDSAFSARAS